MRSAKSFLFGLLIFLIPYILFSFSTYKDFGITADEELEINAGKALGSYFLIGINPDNSVVPERHLPTNSTYLRVYPALLSLLNFKGYFEWYHLINLLAGSILFITFYGFIYRLSSSWRTALLGTFVMFFTPRITGDVPVNLKDIPFATLYFISLYLIYYTSTKLRVSKINLVIMGIVFGLTWGSRIIGLSIFIVYWAYNLFTYKPKKFIDYFIISGNTFVLFIISLIPLFIFMPFFRLNFPESVVSLVTNAKNFEYWDRTFLFMGQFLTKFQRPSSYLPVWLLITTPIYILFPFLLSIFTYLKTRKSVYILGFLAIAINMLLYFIIRPVTYNGPRHFLFLFPIITLISFVSFLDLVYLAKIHGKLLVTSLFVAWIIGLGLTARTMILLHPYEYVYFNELIGGLNGAKGKFEMDYWFSSNKEASEWLSRNVDSGEMKKVYSCNLAFSTRYFSQAKFEIVNKAAEADYIICDYETDLKEGYKYPIVYTVERFGVPLNIVRKAR